MFVPWRAAQIGFLSSNVAIGSDPSRNRWSVKFIKATKRVDAGFSTTNMSYGSWFTPITEPSEGLNYTK
jgi:hypothetical protein